MEQTKISSSQGTQPTHAARGRASTSGADAIDATGAGGFLALLAALGDAPVGDDGAQDLLGADDGSVAVLSSATGTDTVDASALAAWQGVLVPALQDGAANAVAADSPTAAFPSTAVQQSVATVASPLAGDVQGGGGNALTAALVGADGAPFGMVAETAMLDTSADLKGLPQAGNGLGFGRVFSRTHGNALAQKADALEAVGLRAVAGDAGRLPAGAQALVPTLGVQPQTGGERAAAGAAAVERSAVGAPAGELAATVAEGVLTASSARGGEGAGNGSGNGQQGAAAWADGVAASTPQEPGAVADGAVFVDSAQAGAEEQIAEQVAYWVHQKTQNAELTLNRDGQPVEVSVSLTGNEAHVSFRSDQAQTREMLDRSMAQLSDLLRGEGLMLSGMSVGTSAGQGGGAQQQRPRDGERRAQVVAGAPAGTAPSLRGGGVSDRAVDVFV